MYQEGESGSKLFNWKFFFCWLPSKVDRDVVPKEGNIQHSTSLCTEDLGTYSNIVGVIPYNVKLMSSEMNINQSYCTQPDVSLSDGKLMITSSDDSTLLEGGMSLGHKTKAGIDEFESNIENLCGSSYFKTNGLEGHTTHDYESNVGHSKDTQA